MCHLLFDPELQVQKYILLTHRGLIFVQNLIVFGHCNAENNCCDIFEAMNPFFPFRSLPSDVKQPKKRRSYMIISRMYVCRSPNDKDLEVIKTVMSI